MAVEETTEQGWFSRLGDAVKGVVVGIIMIPLCMYLLWWNEGRSVRRYATIGEARSNCIETDANKIDNTNEGKLVHFNGMTATKDILTDKEFSVTVDNSLSLNRKVEMYQWIQEEHTRTEKKAGGKTVKHTTYTYRKDWSSSAINSGNFKESGHDNPGPLPYQANDEIAENVTLGAHKIPGKDASHLGSAVAVQLDSNKVTAPVSAIISGNKIIFNVFKEGKAKQAKQQFEVSLESVTQSVETGDANVASSTVTNNSASAKFNVFQYQPNEGAPEIGDVRITFTNHPVCEATVIAVQKDGSIKPFETKNGNFYEVRTGLKTAEEVFKATEDENALLTWFLRGLGLFLMAVGFGLIFKPISVFADVIPLFGDIAESGISIISGLLALVISATVIAIAWLFYRPLLACCLLLVMAAGIFGITKLILAARAAKKAKAAPVEPAPEPAA